MGVHSMKSINASYLILALAALSLNQNALADSEYSEEHSARPAVRRNYIQQKLEEAQELSAGTQENVYQAPASVQSAKNDPSGAQYRPDQEAAINAQLEKAKAAGIAIASPDQRQKASASAGVEYDVDEARLAALNEELAELPGPTSIGGLKYYGVYRAEDNKRVSDPAKFGQEQTAKMRADLERKYCGENASIRVYKVEPQEADCQAFRKRIDELSIDVATLAADGLFTAKEKLLVHHKSYAINDEAHQMASLCGKWSTVADTRAPAAVRQRQCERQAKKNR